MEVKEKFEFKSEVLKKARETKGYKQDELAKLIFTTRQTISNWENGKKIPTLANIDRLAQVLNVSIDDLIEREGDEEQKTNDEQLDQLDSTNYSLVYTPTIKKSIKDLKWIKIILALILIILVIYLGTSIRKFCILYDIHKKNYEYKSIDNYHIIVDYYNVKDGIYYDAYTEYIYCINNTIKREIEYQTGNETQKEITYINGNQKIIVDSVNKTYKISQNVIEENFIMNRMVSLNTSSLFDNIIKSFNPNFEIINYINYDFKYNYEDSVNTAKVNERINKKTGLLEERIVQIDDNNYSKTKFELKLNTTTPENVIIPNLESYEQK